MSAFSTELNINEYFDPTEVSEANKEYHNLNKHYPYGGDLAAAALTGFAKGVDQRLEKPIFREDSPSLMRQDTTETKRASPGLRRQMSGLSFDDKVDGEVKGIMARPITPTPRVQVISRGSSTIRSPQEMMEDSRKTVERQNVESTGIRHDFAYQAAKRGNPDTAKKFLHGRKNTKRRYSAPGRLNKTKKAAQAIVATGGKTRKRRKRRKTKRRKGKKGGGFFRKSPEQKKRKILMRLLKGDKDKVSRCLELNNTGKACQLDKQNKPGQLTQSCTSYNGMVRGPMGQMCGNVLREAARIYQEGAAKKRRTKRRKRKRRNSTRRKKRS